MTADIAREYLDYDPETGLVTNAQNRRGGRDRLGSEWGSRHKTGSKTYRSGKLCSAQYYAHRIAFLLHVGRWPASQIDHINGNGTDNRWRNLREATPTEQSRNKRKSSNNTSGTTGVSWLTHYQKWRAHIVINGTGRHLGFFDSKAEAIWARESANKEFNFHANHGTTRPL